MLKFIVTGTGRCGTVFMAKLLTSLGIFCGHESIFDYDCEDAIVSRIKGNNRKLSLCSQNKSFLSEQTHIGWVDPNKIVADSSYWAAPYLNNPLVRDIPVIHLIRNPMSVISSFVLDFNYFEFSHPNPYNPYNQEGWENKIYETLPELKEINTSLERACWFYYRWNEMIFNSCKYRSCLLINIDSIDYDSLFNFLNLDKFNINKMFKDTSANTNKKRTKDFTIEQIPNGFIKNVFLQKCKKYILNI